MDSSVLTPTSLVIRTAEELRQPKIKFEDCYFYHVMDIPDHGPVSGEWDLRNAERAYLGDVNLAGKKVLEIGSASGHLSFWMEKQGARVTSFDLGPHVDWDIVPFSHISVPDVLNIKREHIKKLNNSWIFQHQKRRSNANYVNGSLYFVDKEKLGTFDVVTLCSILLHVRDPFLAIQRAADMTTDKIVIADVSEEEFHAGTPEMQDKLCMSMVPRAAAGEPIDTWFFLSSALVTEILNILGFDVTITRHKQKYMTGLEWRYYTAIGTRRKK